MAAQFDRVVFEHIRRDSARTARADSTREAREAREAAPIYLGKSERVQSLDPSRDGAFVMLTATTPPE